MPAPKEQLDAAHVESLLLNVDASLNVYTRGQLFGWTQGLLQSVMPHKALICALRTGERGAFRVDGFSTLLPDAAVLGDLMLRDAPVMPDLIGVWKQHAFRPAVCAPDELSVSSGGRFARQMLSMGAAELLVHGTHDVDAEVVSLCVFACEAGTVGAGELYLAQLLQPFLHAAFVRSQTGFENDSRDDRHEAAVGVGVLTEREREVLHWVYLGKSNGEIGAILDISPLTAKNHVQKILCKLDVVNRAQAVGKALDARIIRP